MTDPAPNSPRTSLGLSALLIVVAVALLVTHFVLDAGSGEAPRWIIWSAILAGLAGALLGGTSFRR